MTPVEVIERLKAKGIRFKLWWTARKVRSDTASPRCPLCALCYEDKGEALPNYEWDKAAALLGVNEDDACRIANAADNEEGHDAELRALMLKELVS